MIDGLLIQENLAGSYLSCALRLQPISLAAPDWAWVTGTTPALVQKLNNAAWKPGSKLCFSSLTKEV